jgi:apolipoprotein N-acyltransferase
MCFDNAFPSVAARAVADGARLLVVVSNEAWYRRGGELAQMAAMTVCRALETGTPMVRATVDGATLAIGADGRTLAALPFGPQPDGGPRVLAVAMPLGAGCLPPLAAVHRLLVWAVLLSGAAVVWHAARSWARLLRARPGRPGDPSARGSRATPEGSA